MYPVGLSVGAAFLLIFLLVHFLKHGSSNNTLSMFFQRYIVYVLVLAVFDIANVMIIRQPAIPASICTEICSTYLAMEIVAVAALTFTLPIFIVDATPAERKSWRLLPIPALMVAALLLFVNTPTGAIFTIDESHIYRTGILHPIMLCCNLFYLVMIGSELITYRKRLDVSRLDLARFEIVIAACGFVAQELFPEVRVTVFALTIIVFEMYLSFLVPEGRFDSLTGLLNSHGFYEEAEKLLGEHPDSPYLIVYCNIRDFKFVNDIYGISAGDTVLAKLGGIISQFAAGKGCAGRMEGDQMALCVDSSLFDLPDFMERMNSPEIKSQLGHDLRMVFGIYCIADKTIAASTMCDYARMAMRSIESSRIQRFAYFGEDDLKSLSDEHDMSVEMEGALRDGEFRVYLQPIVEAQTHKMIAAEALVRWMHPDKGLIAPDRFIPVFERNGLITVLDRFVWESVCQQMQDWRSRGISPMPISVNISAADLDIGLGSYLSELVARHSLPSTLLELEITESVYSNHRDSLSTFIDFIHEKGFKVLMDDFGAGYSSLNSLKSSCFDLIKLDQGFMSEMSADERSYAVVSSTIALADKLGSTVLAEGVETEEQADLMCSLGVDLLQGYLFGRPIPMDEFEKTYLI